MADLIFRQITLYNFKGYPGPITLVLDKKAGLYHVTGNNKLRPGLGGNGVGKSTLFDALLWCLFGKTGRDSKPGAAIVPWHGENKVCVSLEFERDGNQYTLERSRNPNSLHLWKIGKPHDEERELEQDDVPNILGMSEELFRRTIMASQTAVLFLDLRPDAQAQMFSEALELDIWLKAADAAAKASKKAGWDVDELSGKKSVYERLLAGHDKEYKEAKSKSDAEEDRLEAELDKLDKVLKKTNTEIKAARKKLGSAPKLPTAGNKRIEGVLDELQALPEERRKAEHEAQRSHKSKKCHECGQSVQNKALAPELERLNEKFDQKEHKLREELHQLQQARRNLDANYQKEMDVWRREEREVIMLEAEAERLGAQISAIEQQPNQYKALVKKLKVAESENRTELLDVEKRLAWAQEQQKTAELWVKGFKEIRLSIIDEVLLELEVAANRHAELLGLKGWGIRFETERETTTGSLSYKFTVLLFPPDQDTPVKWESYSGGESQRWQLATTFALSEVLLARAGINPNLEIFDEPTKGLSAQGIDDLLEHLSERARETDRAIWFVDHHTLDRGSFDGTLLVTKDKNGSGVQWL